MGMNDEGRFVHFPVSRREGREDGQTIAARLNTLERALGQRIAGWEVLRGFPPGPGEHGTIESWMLIFEQPVNLEKAAGILGPAATAAEVEPAAGTPDGHQTILETNSL